MAKVKIEILRENTETPSWYNEFVGQKLNATESENFYIPDNSDLKKLLGTEVVYAVIPKEYAAIEGEEIKEKNIPTFPLVPRHIKNLVEVRKFVVTKDITRTVRHTGEEAIINAKGNVYEEMYDKPNVIVRMEKGKVVDTIKLKDLNTSTILLTSIKCEETIEAKKSLYFTQRKKEVEREYARKRKKIEQLKDNVNHLGDLLGVEENDNE